MTESPHVDATIEQLRAAGSLKWSRHPDAIGAFVAEADFGTAQVVAKALHDAIDSGLLGYLPDGLQAGLGKAFSAFAHERYGWRVEPERVRPLADVAAGLVAAIDHFS
jgi:cysteine-S-conjugate beta-lyase